MLSSLIDQREWHVLFRGERLGPISGAELRMLLDTHPERWQASVWRPGMLNWRPAASVFALTQGAPAAETLSARPEAPQVDPPRTSVRAPRNASGELRVLSYEERDAPGVDPDPAALPLTPNPKLADAARSVLFTRSLAISGEWSAVATSEFRVVDASELHASNAIEPGLAASGEWSRVATSELRAPDASELRLLAMKDSSAPATSTPPPLPALRSMAVPKSRGRLRALLLFVGGLVLLLALALISIRLR